MAWNVKQLSWIWWVAGQKFLHLSISFSADLSCSELTGRVSLKLVDDRSWIGVRTWKPFQPLSTPFCIIFHSTCMDCSDRNKSILWLLTAWAIAPSDHHGVIDYALLIGQWLQIIVQFHNFRSDIEIQNRYVSYMHKHRNVNWGFTIDARVSDTYIPHQNVFAHILYGSNITMFCIDVIMGKDNLHDYVYQIFVVYCKFD